MKRKFLQAAAKQLFKLEDTLMAKRNKLRKAYVWLPPGQRSKYQWKGEKNSQNILNRLKARNRLHANKLKVFHWLPPK